MTIKRPPVEYVEKGHKYTLHGEKLDGVSTVSKVGEDEVWPIAAAYGFRIGYEGAHDLLLTREGWTPTKDELREALKAHRLTPWHRTEKAAQRGNNVHDALEALAQKGQIEPLETYAEDERPFVQGLARWYLDYRPKFEATEVQVCSEKHKFAGRYDIRATIAGEHVWDDQEGQSPPALCLIDLKTGKGIYPTSHFAQLAGYELAGTEMGYPATDAQFVLNVKEDGTYDFQRSVATPEHFLAYLAAHRAILDIKQKAPKKRKA